MTPAILVQICPQGEADEQDIKMNLALGILDNLMNDFADLLRAGSDS